MEKLLRPGGNGPEGVLEQLLAEAEQKGPSPNGGKRCGKQ